MYFVCGQPGAGKSSLLKKIKEEISSNNSHSQENANFITVELDTFRYLHPNIEKIITTIFNFYENNPNLTDHERFQGMAEDFVAFTQIFAGTVEDNYTRALFNQGYNIAIEKSLRDPSSVIMTAKEMREKNSNAVISVYTVGVSKKVAYEGTVSRAKQMEICIKALNERSSAVQQIIPRFVSEDFYNSVCESLPTSMREINDCLYINGGIIIQNRNGEVLYDNREIDSDDLAENTMRSCLTGEYAQIEEANFDDSLITYGGVDSFIAENYGIVKPFFDGDIEAAKFFFIEQVKQYKHR